MKKIPALAALAGVALLASCKDVLNTQPLGSLTDQTFYQTPKDFDAATLGPYTTMLNLTFEQNGRGWWNAVLLPDDDVESRDPNEAHDFFNWSPSDNYDLGWVWQQGYQGVMRSNVVLDKLPGAKGFANESDKKVYEAQAKFMRGWWYFLLARNWGTPPIYNKVPSAIDETKPGNSTTAALWDLIEADLDFAAKNLPANFGSEKGRATKYTALAMLGKVQLYRAQWFNLPAKYQSAITNLTAAMAGPFTLTANYAWSGGGAYSATLSNCTLTRNSAFFLGGGAGSSSLTNCTLTDNSARVRGGGADVCTLNNCALTGNSATVPDGFGGGACYCTLSNCTVTGNSAPGLGGYAGGAYSSVLNNCIVFYNTAQFAPNYDGGTFAYSCTTPLPPGPGNLDAEPLLASATHLSAQSPCISRGSPVYASGVDIDGETWLSPPCIGADQFVAGAATGVLTMAIMADHTNVATGYPVSLVARNAGRISASIWNFGDGVVMSNRPFASHVWDTPGSFPVRLTGYNDTFPGGISTTLTVQVNAREVYYVNAANTTPLYPYTNWSSAATSAK